MSLKNNILTANSKLADEIINYNTDLEILYSYDRYMKSLLSQMTTLTNINVKEKLVKEFNELTLKCEKEAQILLLSLK